MVSAMMRRRPAPYLTVACTVLVMSSVTGCGGDDPPAVCAAVEALTASVGEVTAVEIAPGALTSFQEDLAQVESDLSEVRDAAEDEYAAEIDAITQASDAARTSLDRAVTSLSAQAVADVGEAVRAVGASLAALEDAVRSTC